MDDHTDDMEAEPDTRRDALAYLDRRKCGICDAPLEAVRVEDLASFHGIRWRMLPPPPECWRLACPACGQRITICVRRGRSWALGGSRVSRRRRAK